MFALSLMQIANANFVVCRPLIGVLFMILGTLILHVVSSTGEDPTLKQYAFPTVIILGVFYSAYYKKGLRLMLMTMVFALAFSSIVAVCQSAGFGPAWDLRLAIGGVPDDAVLKEQIVGRIKPSGLAYFSVQLGYQISVMVPMALALYFVERNRKLKKFIFVAVWLIALGAVAINSIVAMGSVVLSIMILYVVRSKRRVWALAKICIGLTPIFIGLVAAGKLDRVINLRTDANALSRMPMVITGVLILAENPRGLTNAKIDEEKARVGGSLVASMIGSGMVEEMGLHNSFLNCAVKHGIIVLLCYLAIYAYLIKVIISALNKTHGPSKLIVYSLALSLSWYIVQSTFHNAGLPSGDLYGWILVAVILVMGVKQDFFMEAFVRPAKGTS